MSTLRCLTPDDLLRLRRFWIEHWGGDFMVVHGKVYRPNDLEGFVIEDGNEWVGLITFLVTDDQCEVVSLDSLRGGQGMGTELMNAVIEDARRRSFRRVFLVTTNDNLNALGFFQKRGFALVAIHRGSVDESRKIKRTIPMIGENNIPIRDEIELEMVL